MAILPESSHASPFADCGDETSDEDACEVESEVESEHALSANAPSLAVTSSESPPIKAGGAPRDKAIDVNLFALPFQTLPIRFFYKTCR